MSTSTLFRNVRAGSTISKHPTRRVGHVCRFGDHPPRSAGDIDPAESP
jgi:hypothetical protein